MKAVDGKTFQHLQSGKVRHFCTLFAKHLSAKTHLIATSKQILGASLPGKPEIPGLPDCPLGPGNPAFPWRPINPGSPGLPRIPGILKPGGPRFPFEPCKPLPPKKSAKQCNLSEKQTSSLSLRQKHETLLEPCLFEAKHEICKATDTFRKSYKGCGLGFLKRGKKKLE